MPPAVTSALSDPSRHGVAMPSLLGVEHRWVRAGDVVLHVAEAGEGPPLLLLHGWPQHWWIWRHVIGELARTHRVICPDLRGHGWSEAPRGSYAKATLAADILALLDALDVERTPVVGHDWGGWTSFLLGIEAPERISRVLALGIPHPWFRTKRSPRVPLFGSYQLLVSTPVLGQAALRSAPAVFERLIRAGTTHQDAFTDRDLKLYSRILQDPDHAAATTALYRTFLIRETHQRGSLGPLTVPAQVVIGAGDPIRWAVDFGPLDGVGVEILPGAGHFLPEEAPAAVLERIRSFALA